MPLVRDRVVSFPNDPPFSKQSVEVPGTKRPGQTGHYRNAIWGLLSKDSPKTFTTLTQVFDSGLTVGRNQPMLGHRPQISANPLKFANHYVWESWGDVDDRRRAVGSALHLLFNNGELGGGEYETVGIWSQNRPEWQIVDLALNAYAKVSVSIYDTLGKDVVEYIINHSHLTVVFTTADHIPTLLKLKPLVSMLKIIVSIDDLSEEGKRILVEWGLSQSIKVMELRELEALGKANLIDPITPRPDQLAAICYTSGTTSMPKGALLTHENMATAVNANLYGLDLPDEGCLVSYLPLAHIYGRLVESGMMACGGRIGYFTGDPLRLLEDCQILKPHLFPSVPRLLNRIYQAANAAGDLPGLKGFLFKKAVATKLERLRTTGDLTHPLWDRLVFRKVRAVLGGNILMVVSGSAPINAQVLDFLKIVMCCDVLEGYGMTENAATICKTWNGDSTSSGTVGPPQPICEVKLVDVPSMNYTSEDKPHPRGEICVRGPHVIKGYYKDEKNTREAIDEEGWFHSGDVATIDANGRFKIIDRVKNIMKLAQGEYVALEKIENTYSASPAVAQLYVHGDPLQPYLLGVVVADPIYLSNVAVSVADMKISPTDLVALEKVCKDERVQERILSVLGKEAQRNGLKGFETIKRIHLTTDPFTVEDGTLTPTMKIRRKDAYNKHKAVLEELYAKGEPTPKPGFKL
ncbi:long-chain-fatty-acid-CoA ligase [Marasmius fiardii PR-910]|nr:long-chain-fatty-acid-CoA ligase [Marasmius fiardii PR-910]